MHGEYNEREDTVKSAGIAVVVTRRHFPPKSPHTSPGTTRVTVLVVVVTLVVVITVFFTPPPSTTVSFVVIGLFPTTCSWRFATGRSCQMVLTCFPSKSCVVRC